MTITKADLDHALEAWRVARESALLETKAWATLNQAHGDLIASLQANGHTWSQAQAEFAKFVTGHQAAFQAANEAMDKRCSEYLELHRRYMAENGKQPG